MNVGHTVPLPICAVDRTESHRPDPPAPSSDLSAGNSPWSISRLTSAPSAASIPIASVREPLPVFIEQLLRIHPGLPGSGSETGFDHRHRLQIVPAARIRVFTGRHRALELVEQRTLLRHLSRSPPHRARQLSGLAQHQPALTHVQRAALADQAEIELL